MNNFTLIIIVAVVVLLVTCQTKENLTDTQNCLYQCGASSGKKCNGCNNCMSSSPNGLCNHTWADGTTCKKDQCPYNSSQTLPPNSDCMTFTNGTCPAVTTPSAAEACYQYNSIVCNNGMWFGANQCGVSPSTDDALSAAQSEAAKYCSEWEGTWWGKKCKCGQYGKCANPNGWSTTPSVGKCDDCNPKISCPASQ